MQARWPECEEVDHSLRRNDQFCQETLKKLKAALGSTLKKKKGKVAAEDLTVEVFIQTTYSDWQVTVLDFLKEVFEAEGADALSDKTFTKRIQQHLAAQVHCASSLHG